MRTLALALSLSLAAPAAAQEVWPGTSWTTATPESMGMDSVKLREARDYALTGGGSGYITRGGKLVMTWGSATQRYDLKSTTKSFGATALGLAVKDGKMALGDKAQLHHPSLGVPPSTNTATGWLDEITLRHLCTHTAGFDKPGGYEELLFQPGTKWSYSDGGTNWLAECITLKYGQDLNALMFNRVFTPIGITSSALTWRNNAYRPDTINGIKNREFGAGISASVDALARMGLLYLRGGRWQATQIIPQSFVDACRTTVPGVVGVPEYSTTYGNASDHYGLLWWNNADGTIPGAPRDAYWSWGLYESWIMVIPSLDIVASRAGNSLSSTWSGHYGVVRPFLEPIAQSVTAAPPPPSGTSKIWIAAKSGTRTGLMAKGTDYAAGSLAGELVYPNLTTYNTSNTTQADAVSFAVDLPSSGTWYLWARMYYPGTTAQPTNDPNSFWVAADGGAAKTLGNLTSKDRTWHWDGSEGALLSLGSLAAGDHTIKVWNREARETSTAKLSPRLDVVLLTNDPAYVPKDADVSLAGGGGGGGAPYPASAAITGLAWAAASTIVRKAPGCDTWPVTWADDDNLYGAYGDGNGFEPQLSTKLSLGFAKIGGSASSFTGTNIRSPSGEQTGDGASGKKASGMLMVGGTLYMWVRNADNNGRQSQLAWSADRGATWTWSPWKFAEFGYPTFVNYGKNYAGARDGYVYTVSHDNPSAYTQADRFILMRVPKDRIRERAAYEFFRGKDASGNPLWSADITQRAAVFTHAGKCRRSGISYNAALGRYLWWQMIHVNGQDTRFTGGFGVYDAPEPWGPWTTVYYTTAWDVGPGETGSFPTKWMSADGKTVHLVFSGDDKFSVRKATLTVSGAGGNAPPSVNLTAPAANSTYTAPATITLQATASDSNGTVSKVEFFAGATLLGTDATSPYSYSWTNVGAGSYSLTARATDNAGATATSAAVAVTVNPAGNAPPSVAITSPAPGAAFTAPATITIQASASDSDGTVSRVEFYAGGTLLGSDAGSPYSFTWNNVSSGSYSLSAKAVDSGGATAVSASVAVTVNAAGGVVSNTSPAAYAWDVLDVGKMLYVDRSYTFSAVPAGYVGLPYLKTANDDKSSGGSSWISFDLAQQATVYVAHDDRIATKPSWMSGFADTGVALVSGGGTYSLFGRDYPAGRVTLGGNLAGGTTTHSMYSVVVRPLSAAGFAVTIDSVSTGRTYRTTTAQAGALHYVDRSYTVLSLGAALGGGTLLRTANDDKAVTASSHLKFTVSGPAVLHVCYDKRASSVPSWLGSWTLTSENFAVSDGGASPMRVFRKSVAAGQVTLGGNLASGAAGAQSNYVVVVVPSGSGKPAFAANLGLDTWDHPGDTDGDGLYDDFELSGGTDPYLADTDLDGEPDETELSPAGLTLWEAQGAGGRPAGGGGGGSGGRCGALGLEFLLLLLCPRRRQNVGDPSG